MFRKELSYYFSSPIAYIVIGLFLLGISLLLWVIPGEWNIIDSGYAQTDGLFQLSPWLLMLLCPALTMRLFAEERTLGTWDLICTKSYPLWRIVTEKYLAAWTLMLLALLPNLTHYFAVYMIAEPIGNIDGGQFAGSFIGLVLLSGAFLAIGLVMASITKSQIVAFVLGALACFVLYWVTIQDHYSSLSRGVIDLRDIVYFISYVVLSIPLTTLIIGRLTKK
ncbi:MAG: ABC-2 transporter permease [Paludibacteraceae bacterium]|jgi:ABC-2 type transport system permease protein|nr:ABC-2 transporter permease [Paludibacteraceae bacterium]